jgi:hypothetical protein
LTFKFFQTVVISAVSNVITKRVIFLLILLLVFSSSTDGAFDKTDIENWLKRAESTLARTDSYTAIFHKQERIKQKLTEKETIFLKFKKPFKVYMKWVKEPFKGRESLYIDGYNNNLIKVRECGILGIFTVDLDPKGTLIMKGNRHPVTHSGIENLVQLIKRSWERGVSAGEIDIRKKRDESVYGRATKKVEMVFPKKKENSYYCHRVLINFDVETKLPIRVHIYDWNDTLIESYGYEAIKLDAGLTEADFDPNNPEYRF